MTTAATGTAAAVPATTTAGSSSTVAALQGQVASLLGQLGGTATGTPAANGGAAAAPAATTGTGISAATVTPPTTNLNVGTLSSSITSVAQLVSDRQTYLGKVSAAIAADALKTGTPNQEAVVQLNMQTTSLQIINDMNKNLTDALKNTIQTWAQPGQ